MRFREGARECRLDSRLQFPSTKTQICRIIVFFFVMTEKVTDLRRPATRWLRKTPLKLNDMEQRDSQWVGQCFWPSNKILHCLNHVFSVDSPFLSCFFFSFFKNLFFMRVTVFWKMRLNSFVRRFNIAFLRRRLIPLTHSHYIREVSFTTMGVNGLSLVMLFYASPHWAWRQHW